jgi:hypothetical protein
MPIDATHEETLELAKICFERYDKLARQKKKEREIEGCFDNPEILSKEDDPCCEFKLENGKRGRINLAATYEQLVSKKEKE